jgi:hypothetical protein
LNIYSSIMSLKFLLDFGVISKDLCFSSIFSFLNKLIVFFLSKILFFKKRSLEDLFSEIFLLIF